MALEGSPEPHHQKQGSLSAGNAVGGAVGGPAARISTTCNVSAGGGGGGGDGGLALFPLHVIPVPPELANSPFANKLVDIDHRCKVPYGWLRCLNLKNGEIFYKDLLTEVEDEDDDSAGDMSRRGKSPKLDLRLNLSTHRGGDSSSERTAGRSNSPHSSSSSSSTPSSCLSSETEQQGRSSSSSSSSPEATSMMLVGCPRCLMYVMLSEEDPRCPKCKSTVLLDFLKDPKNIATSANKTRKN